MNPALLPPNLYPPTQDYTRGQLQKIQHDLRQLATRLKETPGMTKDFELVKYLEAHIGQCTEMPVLQKPNPHLRYVKHAVLGLLILFSVALLILAMVFGHAVYWNL